MLTNELRTDTPATLPAVKHPSWFTEILQELNIGGSHESVNKGSLPGFLHAALRCDLDDKPEAERAVILEKFRNIKTQKQALEYMKSVQAKMDLQ